VIPEGIFREEDLSSLAFAQKILLIRLLKWELIKLLSLMRENFLPGKGSELKSFCYALPWGGPAAHGTVQDIAF